MRDVRQPCLGPWEKDGIDAAFACCGCEMCAEYVSNNADVDGVHDTCPIRVFAWMMQKAGIGKRERKLILDDVSHGPRLLISEPMAAVMEWLKRKERENIIVLAGTKGIGKTVAACYALARLQRRHYVGRYVLATEVVDPDTKIKRLANHPVLVVDQMGLEYVSTPGWSDSRFTELVVRRDSDMLPTIFVGNISEESFRERYGTLVADRIVGDGVFHVFRAPSLRGKTA
jgi:hypothetical protein